MAYKFIYKHNGYTVERFVIYPHVIMYGNTIVGIKATIANKDFKYIRMHMSNNGWTLDMSMKIGERLIEYIHSHGELDFNEIIDIVVSRWSTEYPTIVVGDYGLGQFEFLEVVGQNIAKQDDVKTLTYMPITSRHAKQLEFNRFEIGVDDENRITIKFVKDENEVARISLHSCSKRWDNNTSKMVIEFLKDHFVNKYIDMNALCDFIDSTWVDSSKHGLVVHMTYAGVMAPPNVLSGVLTH